MVIYGLHTLPICCFVTQHSYSLVAHHLQPHGCFQVNDNPTYEGGCDSPLPRQGQNNSQKPSDIARLSFHLQRVNSGDLIEFPETAEGYVSKVSACMRGAQLHVCLWHSFCVPITSNWYGYHAVYVE